MNQHIAAAVAVPAAAAAAINIRFKSALFTSNPCAWQTTAKGFAPAQGALTASGQLCAAAYQ